MNGGFNGGLQIWQHEVYNAGAFVDAGIHYYRATGKIVLLATGVKFANYMAELMGPTSEEKHRSLPPASRGSTGQALRLVSR